MDGWAFYGDKALSASLVNRLYPGYRFERWEHIGTGLWADAVVVDEDGVEKTVRVNF